MGELDGRVVAITGATGVLGSAVAPRFAQAGARLALLARSADRLDALVATLPGGADRHVAAAADLGDTASVEAAVGTIHERLGSASILLQLVGGYAGGSPFIDADAAELSDQMALNFWSTANAVRAFLPDIMAAAHGRLVTVSTFVAAAPTPKHAAYAASKAAVEALTISVARDLAGTSATANVIVLRAIGSEKPNETRPEEIAAAMLWLCSPQAGATNGQRIPLMGRA